MVGYMLEDKNKDYPKVLGEVMDEVKSTQVVVMAGGLGRRMGLDIPKALIKVCGKTLLDRCIEFYLNCGFRDIVVLVGFKGNLVEKYVKEHYPWVKVGKDPFDPSVKPVGKAKALKYALESGVVNSNRRMVIAFPDDIFLDAHLPLKLLMHHLHGVKMFDVWATAVFAFPANYPFGVGVINGEGLVTEFREKPQVEIATSTGVYLFEPPVYDLIRDIDLNAPKPVEFEETVVPELAKMCKLYSLTIHGNQWIPVNTVKDLERAEKILSAMEKGVLE